MFERFTDRARRVLVLAQEEARLLRHNFIGTEHLLLALADEGEGVAAKALESLGVSSEQMRARLEETIGPAESFTDTGTPPFTPKAKKVLELSLREALQLGHNYLGTEHLLLAIVREGEGVGAQVLVELGVDLGRVRDRVIQLLKGYASSDAHHHSAGVAGKAVQKAEIAAPASSLFGWEDAAEILRRRSLLGDGRTERTTIDGLVYETCSYVPDRPPEIRVSVAGALVTREAFDEYTYEHLPDAEVVDGLGDAATYSPARATLRVLSGSTLILVRVRRHEEPRQLASAVARRALENLARRQAGEE